MRNFFQTALRWFSVVFSGFLGFAQLALGLVATFTGEHNLKLDMFPFQGRDLTNFLLLIGSGTLLSGVGGAFLGGFAGRILRYISPVMALLQSWFLIKGNIMGSQPFTDLVNFPTSLSLAGSSLLNVVGSLLQLRKKA